jgi:hypothetical protein
MSEETDNNIGRRRLLRRAGTVAAGVVGAGAVGATVSSPAQAAPGDPLVQGANANVSPTQLTGNTANPLLTLQNSGGGSLRLAPSGGLDGSEPLGTISTVTYDNGIVDLQIVQDQDYVDYIQTSVFTNQLVPVIPQRLLDTRTAEGRQYVVNRSVLGSDGRMPANSTIHVRVDFLVNGAVAMHGNVTSTLATRNGYLTVYPYGQARPATSTLNYPASKVLASLANGFTVGHGWNQDYEGDTISIYNASAATHVILDVTAFTLAWGWAGVNSAILPDGGGSAAATLKAGGKVAARGPAPLGGPQR